MTSCLFVPTNYEMNDLWYPRDYFQQKFCLNSDGFIKSSPPNATYMYQWTGSSLVQVMAYCLFVTKPLPESMPAYRQLDSWAQISMKFESQFYYFHSRKCIWKCRLLEWRPFCPGGDEFKEVLQKVCFCRVASPCQEHGTKSPLH